MTATPHHPAVRSAPLLGRATGARLLKLLLLAVLVVLIVVPVIRLQLLAFEDGGAGFERALDRPRIGRTLVTTFLLAAGSLCIAMVLGTYLAWMANRLPPRFAIMRALPVLPIVLPPVAGVIGWTFMLSPRPGYLNATLRRLPWWDHLTEGPIDIYTLPWIIIVTGFGLTSFIYLFVSAGLANINHELIEAARVSGSNSRTVFFKIALPLLRPALVYGAVISLLLGLGQFTAPLLLGTNSGVRVITTEMYLAVRQIPFDYPAAAGIGTPLLIFGVVLVAIQRLIVGDERRYVTHGGRAVRGVQRGNGWVPTLVLSGYFVISTLLPLIGLVIVALSKYWTPDIDIAAFTLDNFREALDGSSITGAVRTSLTASLGAMLIAIPIGYLCANVLAQAGSSSVTKRTIDLVVALPLGVPAVVFGVAFLIFYRDGPVQLYGTSWVLILVYATLMLPFSTRMLLTGLLGLGTTYQEASRTSGAGPIRTHLIIMLPLLRTSVVGAAVLVFVLLTHEFAASLLVRSPSTQVMGTVLYENWEHGSYPLVAVVGLIMTFVTTIGVVLAVLLGGRDVLSRL